MTGYTRQSTTKSNGDVILPSDWNDEFDLLESAFSAASGHNHDGTAGGGALISLTSSVSGTLPVANGGTGLTSLTVNGVLYGNGSNNVSQTAEALNEGEVLIADANLIPEFGQVDVGNGNAVTGQLGVSNGGTGANNAPGARSNLGLDQLAAIQTNLVATSAPTVNNDTVQGYEVGSIWIDGSNEDAYICLDNSSGAATWKKITP